jgi:hypothetical protein
LKELKDRHFAAPLVEVVEGWLKDRHFVVEGQVEGQALRGAAVMIFIRSPG